MPKPTRKEEILKSELPPTLPLMALRSTIVYPLGTIAVQMGAPENLALLRAHETPPDNNEVDDLVTRIASAAETLADLIDRIPDEVPAILKMNVSDPGRFADLAATNMNFRIADKDEVLQRLDVGQRLRFILSRLEREVARARVMEDVKRQTEIKIEQHQREFYLRQQLRAIQAELGEADPGEKEAIEILKKIDEAEIRGHRRTYVGAMPGLLLQALRRVQVKDPVLMIDEIDKMSGGGPSGDPTAAMLEVLDPSQNDEFVDHYLNLPFDLSSVLFICTANNLFDIPAPLRDRMEIIKIAGYTVEEKVEIAWRYLIPRLLEEHGITTQDIQFTDEVLGFISSRYSREAGLRNFERNLASLMRKRARRKAEGEEGAWIIDLEKVEEVLGAPRYAAEEAEKEAEVGAVTGLAWTSTGGDLMLIEALRMPGSGRLTVTGQLGDVMRESVDAALSWVKSRAASLGIDDREFRESDLHIHFPAGAIPKDGPSAGIAVTLAIASVMSRRAVRRDVAMTGEVTLRGKVLEIGGVKEKTLAAYRAGLREVMMPKGNEKDLREVPEEVKQHMAFTFAATMDEVVHLALL